MKGLRRARGALLRLARQRVAATAIGLTMVGASVGLMVFDFRWESWMTDGVGIILGGTGVALVVTGLGGQRPDWIES